MDSTLKTNTGMTVMRRVVVRALWGHRFASALILAVLIGGGLRFVPASTAAVPGSSAAGVSTACAAK
jgi:hypothetical protein